ncbi:MAG: hypothetical protein AABY47_06920 [Pseudomonadota bacterium]
MLNAKQLLIMSSLFSLAIGLVGCAKPIPTNLINKLEEKISRNTDEGQKDKFNIGFVTIFDANTEKTKSFVRETQEGKETGITTGIKGESASEIRELTSVSVLGLSGIKINDIEYNSCKYITVNNQREPSKDLSKLICETNKNSNAKLLPPDTLDKELVSELSKVGGIDNIGFLLFNDYKTGKTKLFLGSDNYVVPDVNFPLPKSTMTSLNAWSMVTYKQNPCKTCKVNSSGVEECVYVKDQTC